MSLRVLLVEDEPVAAAGLQSMVGQNGFEVIGRAKDGREGLDMIMSLNPDVAVIDVKLPEIDGLTLAKQVMTEAPLPLIVLTSHTDEKFVEEAAKAGVYAYLVKPAPAETLISTIKMAVARFNEIKEIRRESEENRQALETRKLVERAKYTLMARLSLGEEAAFAHIRDKCRNQNKTMKETAIEILDADTAFLKSVEKAPLSKVRY